MTKEELNKEDESRQRLKRRAFNQSTSNKREIRQNEASQFESSTNKFKSLIVIDNNNNFVNRRESSSSVNRLNQHNHHNSELLKSENIFQTAFVCLKNQTQFLTLTFFVIISVLTNSIYFNFYYLPSITHINQQKNQIEKVNDRVEPRLPYLSYINQDNLRVDNFKSYEHVVFPTIYDQNQQHGSEQTHYKQQQQIEKDHHNTNMNVDLFKQEGHMEASPIVFKSRLNEIKAGKLSFKYITLIMRIHNFALVITVFLSILSH
jgi:hypothetical protein